MSSIISYPSINQFRQIVRDVASLNDGMLPTIQFTGTVKVHGTNASVVMQPDGEQRCQSRKNIITIGNDNCGFAAFHHGHRELFKSFRDDLVKLNSITADQTIVIYGEFAGKGIQKTVAISEVDKFYYVFGVKVLGKDEESNYWLRYYPKLSNSKDIIDARDVREYVIAIDFTKPEISQNMLIEMTNQVEKECPVGKYYGVSGTGEGIVWEHITDAGERMSFKVKGKKHSVSKVKTLAPVDIEKIANVNEFVEYAVTVNRLEQGFQEVCNNDADRKLLGKFIKWISTDIVKEESDTLVENGLCMKDVGNALSTKARNWFFSKELL